MKNFIRLLLSVLILASCSEEDWTPQETISQDPEEKAVAHEMIELGKKLENPYTVENVSHALAALYPTRANVEVPATDLYVRFLPKNSDDFELLDSLGVVLFDYPLDYEIKTEGDWYHDPSIPEDEASWQYAVVPATFEFPGSIKHDLLDRCFIPDEKTVTRGFEDVDWEAVEETSYRQTGNADMLVPETRGSRSKPEGYIKVADNNFYPKKTVGVAGVRIIAHTFVKYAKAYTDGRGYYKMDRKYSAKPRYSIRFRNSAGFKIGFNKIIVTASTSTLGKGSPSGKSITVNEKSGDKLFRRCVVNNAAYDYITKSASYGVAAPPSKLRIWILDFMNPSCTPMIHHGTLLDNSLVKKYLKYYSAVVRIFAPDIVIGTKGQDYKYGEIYAETIHEMAHTSHFAKVGKSYWARYVTNIMKNFLMTGDEYGTGKGEGADITGVGEMWGFFMEQSLYKMRYGREENNKGTYWFHPEALCELEKNGVSKKDMFFALNSDVHDLDTYFEYLMESCPSKKNLIKRVYKQYFK